MLFFDLFFDFSTYCVVYYKYYNILYDTSGVIQWTIKTFTKNFQPSKTMDSFQIVHIPLRWLMIQ
jgi:hypothetical protein